MLKQQFKYQNHVNSLQNPRKNIIDSPFLIEIENALQKHQKSTEIMNIVAGSNRSYAIFSNSIIEWGEIFTSQKQSFQNVNIPNSSQTKQNFHQNSTPNQQNKNKQLINDIHHNHFRNIQIKANRLAVGNSHTFAYSKSEQNSQLYTKFNTQNLHILKQKQNPLIVQQKQKQQFPLKQTPDPISVYCWGSNLNYQLGLEQQKFYSSITKVQLFQEALQAGLALEYISCGQSHTLAVFSLCDNQASNQNSQEYFNQIQNRQHFRLTQIQNQGNKQKRITKLFGWGESKSYQLALDTNAIVPYPVQIQYNFSFPISQIVSNSDYNIALLSNGELYSWGSNIFNRLGLNQSKHVDHRNSRISLQSSLVKENYQVNTNRQTKSEKSEEYTDQIITERKNNSNEMNKKIQKMKIPRKIDLFDKKISQVSLGTYHVLALSIQGECFTWGNGIYGQLGNNRFGQCQPQKISTNHLPEVKFIGCCAGQQHSCILDDNGNIYSCGSNFYGVLGHKKHEYQTKKRRCKIFQKIQYFQQRGVRIKKIASGNKHLLALTEDNKIYGWGSNQKQQIIPNINTSAGSGQNKERVEEISIQEQLIVVNKRVQIEQISKLNNILCRNRKQMLKQSNGQIKQKNQIFQAENDEIQGKIDNQRRNIIKKPLITNNSISTKPQLIKVKNWDKTSQLTIINNSKSNLDIENRIIQWKIRYKAFLQQKRIQEDAMLKQFQEIMTQYKKQTK